MDRQQLLSKIFLLENLDRDEREALLEIATTKRCAARSEVVHKGEAGSQLYGILRGRLKVMSTSEDGRDLVFNIMGPGQVFGDIALFDRGERSATIVALDDCELLCIDRRALLPLLERQPRIAIKLLSAMAARMRRLSELLEDSHFLNLRARLAKKLLDLASVYGEPTSDGVRLDLKLTQQELGDLVGTTRESINKQLRAWTELGMLVSERGQITIARADLLRAQSGELVI